MRVRAAVFLHLCLLVGLFVWANPGQPDLRIGAATTVVVFCTTLLMFFFYNNAQADRWRTLSNSWILATPLTIAGWVFWFVAPPHPFDTSTLLVALLAVLTGNACSLGLSASTTFAHALRPPHPDISDGSLAQEISETFYRKGLPPPHTVGVLAKNLWGTVIIATSDLGTTEAHTKAFAGIEQRLRTHTRLYGLPRHWENGMVLDIRELTAHAKLRCQRRDL
jgi:hypothetical protein